jgi:mRNA interferase RelE/StbE
MPSGYSIEVAPTAYTSLKRIKSKKDQREITKAIDGLAADPERQGKALLGPLATIRSLRAARSRYRVLFKVDSAKKRVCVLLVGERRPGGKEDIYVAARKLLDALLRDE